MVNKNQVTLKVLSTGDQEKRVKKWKKLLATINASQRTLNLHEVMTDVAKLKLTHTTESVDAALTQIFPGSSTRTRMQRLHEIPRDKLEDAINKFRDFKVSTPGDIRSIPVLSTTHLEALGRCSDKATRLKLLADCGAKGWTAAQLRAAVVSKQDSPKIQPLALARQVRARARRLTELLGKVEDDSLLPAVTKVRAKEQGSAIVELTAAAKDLQRLRSQLTAKAKTLEAAEAKLKTLVNQAAKSN